MILQSSIPARCLIGQRCSLDPLLLWLWHSPIAVVPIQPLAQKCPYTTFTFVKRKKKKKKKNALRGVPAVEQWDWQHLGSTETQVQSPAQHSGLLDPAVPWLWLRSQLWLGSDPWPRNSICHRAAKRKKRMPQEMRDTSSGLRIHHTLGKPLLKILKVGQ